MTKKTRASNRNGTIYHDEARNKWVAEISWTDRAGVLRRKKFSGKTRMAVKTKLDSFRRQLLIDSSTFDGNDVPFEEYCERWMTNIEANHLKRKSYDTKHGLLKNRVYPAIGNIPINKIEHNDVQGLVNSLRDDGYAYSTIKQCVGAISGCLKYYRIQTKTSYNPCEGIVLPENTHKQNGDVKYFNEAEIKKIVEAAGAKYSNGKYIYRLGQAIVLLLYTGMRAGELIALTWDDVDFTAKTITVSKNAVVVRDNSPGASTHWITVTQQTTKTNRTRIIPLSTAALSALNILHDINGNQTWVVSSDAGTQLNIKNLERMFSSILTRSGVSHPIKNTDKDGNQTASSGVHILRHTFASMLFANGCDVKTVSDLLGHADTKTTENIYIHLIDKQRVKAIQGLDKFMY